MVQHGYSKAVRIDEFYMLQDVWHDISACGRTLNMTAVPRDKSQKAFAELPRRKSEKLATPQRKAAGWQDARVTVWRLRLAWPRVGGQRI